MTDSPLRVPLYHVQTTAREQRNAFPYFSYHESISKLWADKWRQPCLHSIYPFTDADVNDFDPIFESLVQIANDDPQILYEPDSYAQPFLPVGQKLVERAQEAESLAQFDEACSLYLRAAAVFRIARFPINRSSVSEQAWLFGKDAYAKAGRYLTPGSVAIDIPFTYQSLEAGDRAEAISANLRLPVESRPANGWPVLLFICGLDAYKTDHTPRTQEHVDRGFVTLSFEIPGTGDCPAAPHDPHAPDRIMSSVLDWVAYSEI